MQDLLPSPSAQPRMRRSLVVALALVVAFGAGTAARPMLGSFLAAGLRSPVAPVARGGVPAVAVPRASAAMTAPDLDGKDVRVGLILARGPGAAAPAEALLGAVKDALFACKVNSDNIVESVVPTPFDLPLAARFLALSQSVDVIIPVGVSAPDQVSAAVTKGFMDVSLQTATPVVPGLVDEAAGKQAKELGQQWGRSAVEMAMLRQSTLGAKKRSFYGFGTGDEEDTRDSFTGEPLSPERKKVGF